MADDRLDQLFEKQDWIETALNFFRGKRDLTLDEWAQINKLSAEWDKVTKEITALLENS